MPEKHDSPRGPGGRPRDHSLDGTSRARGRTLRDAPPPATSRYAQLVALMAERGVKFGDRLAAFNGDADLSDADVALLALASDYSMYERSTNRRSWPPLFSVAELDALLDGSGPTSAPWRTDTPRPA